MEVTEKDSTAHAEITAIREAHRKLGRNLSGCVLVCTHEPCPMCAAAVVWSGITEIAYGFSIEDAVVQGRKRIELNCQEMFEKAKVEIKVHENILKEECAVLYRSDVRAEIERLRNADAQRLSELNIKSTQKRVAWFERKKQTFHLSMDNPLEAGYQLLIKRLNVSPEEAPIITRTESEVVFHSANFCPTLEACKILGLDTKVICKALNEGSTDALIKQVDCRLKFSRNYQKIRPYTEYCEEKISLRQ